ncbi:hypothetical protein PFLA_b0160 [Pseudoalteromonas flavipulchra NCIMB 2033 = ATCC BAA-314]|nr:hypothetical protein [Pseudoalteromonas flavipulchra NCIMB 2033 = ATCC BAA-314]
MASANRLAMSSAVEGENSHISSNASCEAMMKRTIKQQY